MITDLVNGTMPHFGLGFGFGPGPGWSGGHAGRDPAGPLDPADHRGPHADHGGTVDHFDHGAVDLHDHQAGQPLHHQGLTRPGCPGSTARR